MALRALTHWYQELVEVVKGGTGKGKRVRRRPLCTFVWKAMRGDPSNPILPQISWQSSLASLIESPLNML